MKIRTIVASLSIALLSIGGGATAYGLSHHHQFSAACQTAADTQDAYAQLADRQGYLTTYTNQQTLAANQIDAVLVGNMIKAGCPQTIRYFDMITGEWVN
jgi:hypothetical protein